MRTTLTRSAFLAFLLSTCGCAAVFRDQKVRVHVESEPADADIRIDDQPVGKTPGDVEVDRSASTALKVSKPGYADSRGAVVKHLNAGWAIADVATCVIPVALCIPLLVDAISGAWMDVDERYRVRLEPPGPGQEPPPGTIVVPPPGQPGAPPWSPPPDGGVEPGTIQL